MLLGAFLIAATVIRPPLTRAGIRVDAPELRQGQVRAYESRAAAWLFAHRVGPRRSGDDPLVVLALRSVDDGWHLSIAADDDEVAQRGCTGCDALALLDEVAPALDDGFENPGLPVVVEAPTVAKSPARRLEPEVWSRRKQAGVGLMIGGSAMVAGGAVLAAWTREISAPGENPTRIADFRPLGYAALGVGAVSLVAGAVLLAVDARAKRTRLLAQGFTVRF